MKKGSALLIVLGMMAFMIISAVAFSAYMRYARLPNSYLRRASSTRLLAKAALAEAIDQVDAAIGDNVHPNVGRRLPRSGAGGVGSGEADGVKNETLDVRNAWAHRVYLGTNSVSNLLEPDPDEDDEKGTVATLTFEGLAYIPPPLVNYARYYSRRSMAAKWHSLGYDSGRYAFCAIDVSDYLDVNALTANAGRSSAACGRITLAHLFESWPDHTSYDQNPDDWDGTKFMKGNFRTDSPLVAAMNGSALEQNDDIVPLVSVADLNLALYDKKPAKFKSPFCEYVANNQKGFYNGADETMEEGARIAGMTFVTDAYYPSAGGSGTGDDFDLADPVNQPWDPSVWSGSSGPAGAAAVSLGDVMDGKLTEAGKRIRSRISSLGMAMLFDYLDDDNVPVSLSIPQVERTPMIAGFEVQPGGDPAAVSIKMQEEPGADPLSDGYPSEWGGVQAGPGKMSRTIKYRRTYALDGQKLSKALIQNVRTVLAYPFHGGPDVTGPGAFQLDGHLSLFMTTGDFRFRTENAGEDSPFRMSLENDSNLGVDTQLPAKGVFNVRFDGSDITLPSAANVDESQAVFQKDLSAPLASAGAVVSAVDGVKLLTVNWLQDQTAQLIQQDPPMYSWQNSGDPRVDTAECGIPPVGPDGNPDEDFVSSDRLKGLLFANGAATDGKTVSVRLALWLRVRSTDGKETYDLVPACLDDDKRFLKIDNNASMGPAGSVDYGKAGPVMFLTGGSFQFKLGASGGLDQFTDLPLTFITAEGKHGAICPDPRWNWAPEHWYAVESVSPEGWLAEVKNLRNDGSGRDKDIFMATSDAGYLQSIYELAFLPRVTDRNERMTQHGYGDGSKGTIDAPDTPTTWVTAATDVRNVDHFWRTYYPYAQTGASGETVLRDEFDGGGNPWFVNEGGGCKINPYSDDTNVVMAAFANTPIDWWAASTNEFAISKDERLKAEDFNKKYAFNAMNGEASRQIPWDDLKAVAASYIQTIHGKPDGTGGINNDKGGDKLDVEAWEEYWDKLDWDGKDGGFCGVTSDVLDKLVDVDRKFLYGYWRDCFAPRQQLFLIFVRAEPLMMGGGRSMPPQMGAKAVALVWRDPIAWEEGKPHRTRVLFYRQFE